MGLNLKSAITKVGFVTLALWLVAGPVQATDHSTGGYIGLDYTYGTMGDVDAKFRKSSDVSYELDAASKAGSVSFGWDFGSVRAEVKATYAEGDVDSVDATATKSGSAYNYGLVTIGALYDFDDIQLHKSISLSPFIGLGVGADGGYMTAQKVGEINCGGGGAGPGECSGGDDRSGFGFAARGSLGAALNLHKHLALTTGYEYVQGSQSQNHLVNAGIRLKF